jgi:sugar phosphate isomerase/epimerase
MYSIGVNLGFAVNRYPEPKDWVPLIADQIGVKRVQFVADLLNPSLPAQLRVRKVNEINKLAARHGIIIESAFTGAFTRVNHFGSTDPDVRDYWMEWFKAYIVQSSDMGAEIFGGHPGIMSLGVDNDPVLRREAIENIVDAWVELMEFAQGFGYTAAAWEPMSISREIGHTLFDARSFQDMLKAKTNLVGICYDLDHGDIESKDQRDLKPSEWISEFSSDIKMMHLKQTTIDRRKNMAFTKDNNLIGTIDAIQILEKLKSENVQECTLYLELGFRERNPDDRNAIQGNSASVDYWLNSGASL